MHRALRRQELRRLASRARTSPIFPTAFVAEELSGDETPSFFDGTRLLNEARAVNIVQHPSLVNIFEFGRLEDGTAYIIMEYLEGETLRHRLARSSGRLSTDAVRITRQIASALTAAHAKGIVHRDLKPANVMLVSDADVVGGERVKVLDFGIAEVRCRFPDGKNRDQHATASLRKIDPCFAKRILRHGSAYIRYRRCRPVRRCDLVCYIHKKRIPSRALVDHPRIVDQETVMSQNTLHILVGIDFTDGAAMALSHALKLAERTRSRLHLAHVANLL